jgi:hypothetical protein
LTMSRAVLLVHVTIVNMICNIPSY